MHPTETKNRICPVERAGGLDNALRRWLCNPRKILGPFIREGMSVLDLGCGPGFFLRDLATLVGPAGRVIAADLQAGMLAKAHDTIKGTPLEARITLHRCAERAIGLQDQVDFVLAFYMVHEVPDTAALFTELAMILAAGGRMLIVEPPLHVSRLDFKKTLDAARKAGFLVENGPRMFLQKTAVLRKPADTKRSG